MNNSTNCNHYQLNWSDSLLRPYHYNLQRHCSSDKRHILELFKCCWTAHSCTATITFMPYVLVERVVPGQNCSMAERKIIGKNCWFFFLKHCIKWWNQIISALPDTKQRRLRISRRVTKPTFVNFPKPNHDNWKKFRHLPRTINVNCASNCLLKTLGYPRIANYT